ncbi:hypothetical protein Q5752_005801 [Cryptotrichosporon argae]
MGAAGGIISAGGGIGCVWMPFLFQALLDRVGFRWTLRIAALYTAVLGSGAFVLVKPRIPIARASQGFEFYNVGLFLPRFLDTLDATKGAALLAAFNRMQPSLAMAYSSILGCVFVLAVWGVGGVIGLAVLAPFAIGFALFTSGYTSMWSRVAHRLAGPDKEEQTMLFAGISVARGIGAAVGPIVGTALYRMPSTSGPLRWGSAGSPGLVALVAVSLAASAGAGLVFEYWSAMSQAVKRARAAQAPRRGEAYAMTAGAVAAR